MTDTNKERAGRFTKKQVTIDAWLIDFGNKPLPDWVHEAFRTEEIDWCPGGGGLHINTLEGCMMGANGSWLIKGVQGELYACKPDIFAASYERASLAAPPTAQAEGWRPIETAPTDGHFLVCERDEVFMAKRSRNYSGFAIAYDGQALEPTHWMPLPPPPTSAEEVEHG